MTNSLRFCASHIELFARYRTLIIKAEDEGLDPFAKDPRLSLANLRWMATQCIAHISVWPEDKISRWLGFIQGCLATRGYIDVDAERDATRPMFHAILQEKGIDPPESTSRS